MTIKNPPDTTTNLQPKYQLREFIDFEYVTHSCPQNTHDNSEQMKQIIPIASNNKRKESDTG